MVDFVRHEIGARIAQAQKILVVSHIRPDGDAVGSLLGLGLSLRAAGKDVQMVLSDGVPDKFKHLAGWETILTCPAGPADFCIVVDCSDLLRVGDALDGISVPGLNIDHHKTNLNFAEINLVVTSAAATAQIIADLLVSLDLPIPQPAANALLNGIVTDTIGFRTSNMTADVLRVAASLMDAGGDLAGVYYPSLVQQTYQSARYWGAGLSRLQREDGIVWTSLSLEDQKTSGYLDADDADLVNILSVIERVEIAVIFIQQSPERVKISWRLCGPAATSLDVSQVAQRFGGGGHKAAAGAEVDGALDEVQERVLKATRELFI